MNSNVLSELEALVINFDESKDRTASASSAMRELGDLELVRIGGACAVYYG